MENRDSIIDQAGPFRKSELFLVVSVLALTLTVQLYATSSTSLISRKFWLDEIFTNTLLSDPDFGHALRALKNGAPDHHPPAYYLLARGLFADKINEAKLRFFSLGAVLLALTGAYVLLRSICSPYPAMVALLALWCHPLIIEYAFEARPYALWLAASVWLAVFLIQVQRRPAPWYSHAMLAVTAAVLCTAHYFGIVALLCMLAGHVVCRKVPWHKDWWRLSALWAGPLALAVCSPFLLEQRGTLIVPTWLPPPSAAHLVTFVVDLVPVRAIAVACVVLILIRRFGFQQRAGVQRASSAGRQPPADHAGESAMSQLGAVLGLSLLPLVLIVMSYVVQPVQLGRYALPAVVVFGVLFAYWFHIFSRPVLPLVGGAFVLLGAFELHRSAQERERIDENVDRVIAVARHAGSDEPVIFLRPFYLFPVVHYAPDLADRCFLLKFAANRPGGLYYPHRFDQALVQRVQRFYGRPRMLDINMLYRYPHATLLLLAGQKPEDFAVDFRGYTIDSADEISMAGESRGVVCRLKKQGNQPAGRRQTPITDLPAR